MKKTRPPPPALKGTNIRAELSNFFWTSFLLVGFLPYLQLPLERGYVSSKVWQGGKAKTNLFCSR